MNTPADTPTDRALDQGFRLDAVRIDPQACEAEGPGGREKLDAKVMDVLVVLARHAGKVVLREQLFEQVWPGTVVSDQALSRCIHELRRHLVQAGGSDQYKELIETVPKRGYRLNSTVSPIELQPRRQWLRGSKLWAAGAAVVAIAVALLVGRMSNVPDRPALSADPATAPSIAVLPFIDMSAGQDQAHLADGVAEEILNRLAKIDGLRVIARTSSFSFRDRPADIAEIGHQLGVSHVLEGSVRRSQNEVRITTQLIAVSSNAHVWSEIFTRTFDDLFAAQDEIAAAVASALQIKLAQDLARAQKSISGQALESYLRGQFHFMRRSPDDVELSLRYFEEAVATDPEYAKAWAGIAAACSVLAWQLKTPDESLQKRQGEAARRAVELDPTLATAHSRLAQYYDQTQDFKLAKEHWLKAATLDPHDVLVVGITASEAFSRGDHAVAIAVLRDFLARDPLANIQRQNLAVMLFADRQLDAAEVEYRRLLQRNPLVGWDVEIEFARIFAMQGRYGEVRSEIARMPPGKHRDHAQALLFDAPGSRADADAALERLAAAPVEIIDLIRLAEIYAFRGMKEKAFATLQEKKDAITRESGPLAPTIWHFKTEAEVAPFLSPLHSDPRWATLVADPI